MTAAWEAALAPEPEAERPSHSAPRQPRKVDGTREEKRRHAYAEAALLSESEAVRNAAKGERNHQLNRSAFALGQLVAGAHLTEDEVITELTDAARAAGLGKVEIQKTIASGLKGGKAEPRSIPEPEPEPSNGMGNGMPEPPPGRFDDEHEPIEPPAEADAQTASLFATKWISLGDQPDLLTSEPPRQRWLLTRYHHGREIGVLPRGKTGVIVGAGGSSKTNVSIQLGVDVARGGVWLDTFHVQEPGHVLLALAEEDLDEFRRRFWRACNARELSLDERRELAARVHVLPLHGQPVALLASPAPGVLIPSPAAQQLRHELEQRGVDWSLVILDPLSRWASGGVEGDNEAATRFCQVVETLTTVRGNPTVLVVHHSSQSSVRSGSSDARGVTGIRDGFRWMASLDVTEGESGERAIRLRNKKSNYSLEFEELTLVRSQEPGCEGMLRLATPAEAQHLSPEPAGTGRPTVSDDDLAERLLATLRKLGRAKAKRDLVEKTEGTDGKKYAALSALLSSGRIVRDAEGFMVAAETHDAAEPAAKDAAQ